MNLPTTGTVVVRQRRGCWSLASVQQTATGIRAPFGQWGVEYNTVGGLP